MVAATANNLLTFGRLVGVDTSLFDDTDRFSQWAPVSPIRLEGMTKGTKTRPKVGRIVGVASSEISDEDEDEVDQDGLDWSYFVGKGTRKGHGLIILEHPVGVINAIGQPVSVTRTRITSEVTGKLVEATEVAGDIWLEDKLGAHTFRKARVMKRAGNQRKLGFSIEGGVKERRGKRIAKAKVKWLAVTAAPRNHDSWWEPLMMSVMAKAAVGYPTQGVPSAGAIAPLVAQSLQGNSTVERDQLVMKIAKIWSQSLTWSEAERVFDELVKVLTAKGYNVRIS